MPSFVAPLALTRRLEPPPHPAWFANISRASRRQRVNRLTRPVAAALLTAVLAGCGLGTPPAPTGAPTTSTTATVYPGDGERTEAVVERVIDGDTLITRVDGQAVNVRLLGIDAPERSPRECGYQHATDHLTTLTPPGSSVTLVRDTGEDDRDRFGRWLRYARAAELDASREMVAAGWARVYGRYPTSATPELRSAEHEAQLDGLGIWADGCPP